MRVHAALRCAIIERVYLPGETLSRSEIAGRMDVSVTPVREALDLLAGEGFVTVKPRSGTEVAVIDIQALHEGQFLAVAMGREAVRRLAARPEAAESLRSALDDREDFRRALLAGVGMERLWISLARYFGALERCRALGDAPDEPRARREEVLERIAAGDGKGADAAFWALAVDDLSRLGKWRSAHPEMFG